MFFQIIHRCILFFKPFFNQKTKQFNCYIILGKKGKFLSTPKRASLSRLKLALGLYLIKIVPTIIRGSLLRMVGVG